MGSRRERKCVMGWLGIVAVLGNLLASVLCIVPVRAAGPVDDILGPLILCTEHGPQAVPGNAPASGGDQRDDKRSHCTACTLLSGLAVMAALVFAILVFTAGIFRPFACSARTLADHLSLGGIRSRAPPVCA